MSLVNISIVGNLARAPEQKYFSTGKVKTTLVVAVNGGKKSQQEQAAEFYRVETWGKLAEATGKYLAKGNQITVSGRLVLDYWTDRSGKERVTPIVEAAQLAFPPKLRVVGAEDEVQEGQEGDAVNPISGEVVMSDDDDDDDNDADDDDESDRSDNGRDAHIRTAPERKGKIRRTA